jgi:nucleoside phosphorylase/CheY-like chemotaxis protein
LKILIVEDDAEKLRIVAQHLLEACGVKPGDIQDARDATSAKTALRATAFDLLVLDINLPSRFDVEARPETGILLLKELVARDIYKRPMHIIGLTALDNAHKLAQPEFMDLSFSLVSYDRSSDRWKETLTKICEHIAVGQFSAPSAVKYDYDVCVIAAMYDPELKAVLDLPWHWEASEVPGDNTIYYFGRTQSKERELKIVATNCPRMGMPAAAILTSKMIERFRPRYIVMVGILAGVGSELNFGDVLIADPSWDYESGKRKVVGKAAKFEAAPHQMNVAPELRAKIDKLISDYEFLDQIKRDWVGPKINYPLRAKRGPVASGGSVIEDQKVVALIKEQHRKLIGVEMETYGVLLAAHEATFPKPQAVSMKSICDFADEDKNNDHQVYASYTSARFMAKLVESSLDYDV